MERSRREWISPLKPEDAGAVPTKSPLPSIVIERRRSGSRSLFQKENVMTFIEPDGPGGEPEIMPPEPPGPDIDPSDVPEEMPQQDPGGGGPGDSRPYGGQ